MRAGRGQLRRALVLGVALACTVGCESRAAADDSASSTAASDRAAPAAPDDLLILTTEPAAFEAVRVRLDVTDEGLNAPVLREGADEQASRATRWSSGAVRTERYGVSYRVIVGLATEGPAGTQEAARFALERWSPRFVILLGSASGTGASASPPRATIGIGRLVWEFELRDRAVEPDFARFFRTAPSVLAAALAMRGEWLAASLGGSPEASSPVALVAGAVASSVHLPEHADAALLAAILRANPRTIVVERDAAVVALLVADAADSGRNVELASFHGVVPPQADAQRRVEAAELAAAFAVALVKRNWPLPPSTR